MSGVDLPRDTGSYSAFYIESVLARESPRGYKSFRLTARVTDSWLLSMRDANLLCVSSRNSHIACWNNDLQPL